jgi:hypothetical protein
MALVLNLSNGVNRVEMALLLNVSDDVGAESGGGCPLQVAFVLGLGETFNGDIYTQLAEHPFMATLLVGNCPPKPAVASAGVPRS